MTDDLSSLLGSLTGGAGGDPTESIGKLVSAVQEEGGLDALLGKLQGAGLGGAVDSWVGGGPNEALEPQKLGEALGADEVQRLSSKSGLDIGALLPLLAAFLPQIINMLSPGGKSPEGGFNDAAAQGGLPDLGSILGGVLGGGAGGGGLEDVLGGVLGGATGAAATTSGGVEDILPPGTGQTASGNALDDLLGGASEAAPSSGGGGLGDILGGLFGRKKDS